MHYIVSSKSLTIFAYFWLPNKEILVNLINGLRSVLNDQIDFKKCMKQDKKLKWNELQKHKQK